MNSNRLLRQIPKVDELLSDPRLEGFSRPVAGKAVRQRLEELRVSVLEGALETLPHRQEMMEEIFARIIGLERMGLRRVINATGIASWYSKLE